MSLVVANVFAASHDSALRRPWIRKRKGMVRQGQP
jgi:hypothetical protein